MPFDFDRPSLESSPAAHDACAIPPDGTARDLELLQPWLPQNDTILDLGCGTGRHVRALCHAGYHTQGLDLDPRMIEAARLADPQAPPERYRMADAAEPFADQRYGAILLLNRSLVCFHSHRLATGLFRSVAKALRADGLFLIDNCCTQLWDQVREGFFADGISDDGSEQLFFLPGENRFVWRQGEAVEPNNWQVLTSDRIFRLWSLGEVALAAAGAGLAITCAEAEHPLIVCRRTNSIS